MSQIPLEHFEFTFADHGAYCLSDLAVTAVWHRAEMPGDSIRHLRSAGIETANPLDRDHMKAYLPYEKCDFIYRTRITPKEGHAYALTCHGLDTFCDIYLDRKLIHRSDSSFIRLHLDLTAHGSVGAEREVIFVFLSPIEYAAKLHPEFDPAKYSVVFDEPLRVLMRKPQFHYGWDNAPHLAGVGFIGRPFLEETAQPLLVRHVKFHYFYDWKAKHASFSVSLNGSAHAPAQVCPVLSFGSEEVWRGNFLHSDKELESIWQACAHTQEICALDAFVDTPWREQAQWWGDALYQGENLHWLMGDSRLYARGIEIVGEQKTSDGLTYGLAPSLAHGCILPDFSLIWITTVWEHYWQTGDLTAFRNQKERIKQVLGYFAAQYDPHYCLVRSDARHWLFLDWAPVYKGAYPAILSFLLLRALQTTAKLALLDQDFAWEKELILWIKELSHGLGSLRRADGLWGDGRDEKGLPCEVVTIHSQILAVMTGLERQPGRSWLEKALLPALGAESSLLVKTNLQWYSELFELLAPLGYAEVIIHWIKRVWGPMAEYGSTFERSDFISGRHSRSHAWTAHPMVHLMKILGGVRQTAPGWSEATLSPSFIGDHCQTKVPTPHGCLSVAWTRAASGIDLKCDIPSGIKVSGTFLPSASNMIPAGRHIWQFEKGKAMPSPLNV